MNYSLIIDYNESKSAFQFSTSFGLVMLAYPSSLPSVYLASFCCGETYSYKYPDANNLVCTECRANSPVNEACLAGWDAYSQIKSWDYEVLVEWAELFFKNTLEANIVASHLHEKLYGAVWNLMVSYINDAPILEDELDDFLKTQGKAIKTLCSNLSENFTSI